MAGENTEKIMYEILNRELDYEVSRYRNLENKSYIALVIVSFLLPLIYTTIEKNLLGITVKTPLIEYSFKKMLLILTLFFIILSIYFFLNVLNTKQRERICLSKFEKQYFSVENSKIYGSMVKNLKKIICKGRESTNEKLDDYNRGLLFLKLAFGTFIFYFFTKLL